MLPLCTTILQFLPKAPASERSSTSLVLQVLNAAMKREVFLEDGAIVCALVRLLAAVSIAGLKVPIKSAVRKTGVNLMIRIWKRYFGLSVWLASVVCGREIGLLELECGCACVERLECVECREGDVQKCTDQCREGDAQNCRDQCGVHFTNRCTFIPSNCPNSPHTHAISSKHFASLILWPESEEVASAYYICLVGFLVEWKQPEALNFIFSSPKGPASLLLGGADLKITNSIVKLVSRLELKHSPIHSSKAVLKAALEMEKVQCPCDFICNAGWFVAFDEHFADYLDYFCFFASKAKKLLQAIKVLSGIRRNELFMLDVALLSLELEAVSTCEVGLKPFQFSLVECKSEKEQRKVNKFIVQIQNLCLKIVERGKLNVLKSDFASSLRVIAPLNEALLQFVALNILTCDQLIGNSIEIPSEIRIYALLSHCGNGDYSELFPQDTLIRQIYDFKCKGEFVALFKAPEHPSALDFFAVRPLMLIALLQGEFKYATSLYHFYKSAKETPSFSPLNVDFIYCLVLFEMGFEEPSRTKLSALENPYARLLYLFISNSFGSKQDLAMELHSGPSVPLFLRSFVGSLVDLIEDRLESSLLHLKKGLKILDSLMNTDSYGLVFENILLLSYFYLLSLYQAVGVCMIKGAVKNALWYNQKGLEYSTKCVKSRYFIELFEARQELLSFLQNKSAPVSSIGASNVKALLDQSHFKTLNLTLNKGISDYYRQKYHLHLRIHVDCSRLYSDDLARSRLLFTPEEYLGNFVSCLISGSIKTIDQALEAIIDKESASISDYQKAVCIELSRGNSLVREMNQNLNLSLVWKWINGEFHQAFIPPGTRVISFRTIGDSAFFICIWTRLNGLFRLQRLEFPVSSLRTEWLSIMQTNKESLTVDSTATIDPQAYWNARNQSDQRIFHFLKRIGDLLGVLKGLFTFNMDQFDAVLFENLSRILNTSSSDTLKLFVQLAQETFPLSDEQLLNSLSALNLSCSAADAVQVKTELEYFAIYQQPYSQKERILYVPCKDFFSIPLENIPFLSSKCFITRISSLWLFYLSKKPSPKERTITGVLNPMGDLVSTQSTFEPLFQKHFTHFSVGLPTLSELQYLNLCQKSSLFVYCGHGGAEAIIRRSLITQSTLACEVALMGCSSGKGQFEAGWFDVDATPNAYLVAGSPLVTAALWDVTDKDIDRVLEKALDRYFVAAEGKRLAEFIHEARLTACLLKSATGRALVFYGLV